MRNAHYLITHAHTMAKWVAHSFEDEATCIYLDIFVCVCGLCIWKRLILCSFVRRFSGDEKHIYFTSIFLVHTNSAPPRMYIFNFVLISRWKQKNFLIYPIAKCLHIAICCADKSSAIRVRTAIWTNGFYKIFCWIMCCFAWLGGRLGHTPNQRGEEKKKQIQNGRSWKCVRVREQTHTHTHASWHKFRKLLLNAKRI